MAQLRTALLAASAVSAVALAMSPDARATVLPFQVTPGGLGAPNSPFTATDIQGTSDSLIQQTGLSTQVETGWVLVTAMSNNGSPVLAGTSGLTVNYNLYLTFTATVTGLNGFGGGTGTITSFNFDLYGDPGTFGTPPGALDTFNPGTTSSTGGTAPTITDPNNNDVKLASGTLISGTAGFLPTTDAPFLDVITTFDLTTPGSAVFTQPIPFYQIALTSNTPSQGGNITSQDPGNPGPPNATLNGVVSDTTFAVPEPGSLALLGAALVGFGTFRRRRKSKV